MKFPPYTWEPPITKGHLSEGHIVYSVMVFISKVCSFTMNR